MNLMPGSFWYFPSSISRQQTPNFWKYLSEKWPNPNWPMERDSYIQTATESILRYHPVELHFSLYLLWLDKILKFHVATDRGKKKIPQGSVSSYGSMNKWFQFNSIPQCFEECGAVSLYLCYTLPVLQRMHLNESYKSSTFKVRLDYLRLHFQNTDELGWINF